MSVAFGMENEFQLKGNTVLTKEAWRWFHIHPIIFLIGKTTYFTFVFLLVASVVRAIYKSQMYPDSCNFPEYHSQIRNKW